MSMTIKPITRHKIRLRTVFAVYACLMRQASGMDADAMDVLNGVNGLVDLVYDETYSQVPFDVDFLRIYAAALKNQDGIVEAINAFLDGWTFDRLSVVTQAIILVCFSEAAVLKVTPKPVAINEALTIAKEYIDSKEARYLNAVLERSISDALGIESDYQGKGKVHVEVKEMDDTALIDAILSGKAHLATPKAAPFPAGQRRPRPAVPTVPDPVTGDGTDSDDAGK